MLIVLHFYNVIFSCIYHKRCGQERQLSCSGNCLLKRWSSSAKQLKIMWNLQPHTEMKIEKPIKKSRQTKSSGRNGKFKVTITIHILACSGTNNLPMSPQEIPLWFKCSLFFYKVFDSLIYWWYGTVPSKFSWFLDLNWKFSWSFWNGKLRLL